MVDVVSVRTKDERTLFDALAGAEPLGDERLRMQAPTESLLISGEARCSIWTDNTPSFEGERVGVIGHYAASSDHAAKTILDEACARIRHRGKKTVIGPMDGSTWRRYRFVTDPGTEPPFFLEPTNPPTFPRHWTSSGFSSFASYISTLAPRPTTADPRAQEANARAEEAGIRIRTMRTDDYNRELQNVYQLSVRSFANNFLYTPISSAEFQAQYAALQPYLDPRLVLMAEQGNRLVAFSFAVPNVLEKKPGSPVVTAVLKTLAVDPSLAGKGLGALLTARTLEACWQSGYQRVIGALMHEDNRSRRISDHYAHVMRRYELFRRTIQEAPK